MALDLLPNTRTGPLPFALARKIRSILSAPGGDPGAALSLADDLDRMADMGGGVFSSTPAELRRGAFVLRELSQAAGTRPLTAIEADRSARQ